ncbi:glycosyltransferase family 39 protein [Candidatus Uhrbacteria bacterium]|nr:glycosyltransferase family 39 protein [Candidatus Uhrbacteria bacterium]
MRPPNSLRPYGWLLAVGAIALFAMLFRLDGRPIEHWDEGIHGAVSFEMREDGDWLTPHYMGGTYFRKPPLKIWATALLFASFGANYWTLRLPSALAGIATTLLVAWWVWEWRRDRTTAFLAGTITATMRPIFFHAFRTGEMDGMLTFFIVAALYSWWKITNPVFRTTDATEERNPSLPSWRGGQSGWAICLGAALGLAVMTKSAGGLLPLPIIAFDWLLHRRTIRIPWRACLAGSAAFLCIALPWHLAMTLRHGMHFWASYLGWHVVQRVATTLHNETAGTWWYFPTLARRFTPYTFWLIPAFLFALRDIWKRNDRTHALLLLWFAVGFIGYSAARTKFDWYLLPLYPAAAMSIAVFLRAARMATQDWLIGVGHLAALAASIAYFPALFPDGSRADAWIERAYAPLLHPLVAASAAAAISICCIHVARHRWPHHLERILMTITLSTVLIPGFAITLHHLRARGPEHPFADVATRIAGTHGTLVSFGLEYQQQPAGYYLLRSRLTNDVRILDGQNDATRTLAMLRERSPAFLLTPRSSTIPPSMHASIGDAELFGDFLLWRRK